MKIVEVVNIALQSEPALSLKGDDFYLESASDDTLLLVYKYIFPGKHVATERHFDQSSSMVNFQSLVSFPFVDKQIEQANNGNRFDPVATISHCASPFDISIEIPTDVAGQR